ncbi:MAG: GvpL/GvpF family gas vesicle protein [Syntrophobacteraceae bacterium]
MKATDKSETAIYLFCFAKEGLLPDLSAVEAESPGADTRLSVFSVAGVAVVYGFVPLDDFTGTGAEERLSDIDWVGPRAIFHEKVIEGVARHSPVFPAPFGTIYLSEGSLLAYLRTHLGTVSKFLDFVSDKNEWAVKAYIEPEKSRETFRGQFFGGTEELPASPGARYMQQRRMQQTAADRFREWIGMILAEARQLLGTSASELKQRNPLPESGLDEPAEMVANWAFLVAGSEEQRLVSSVHQLNELHSEKGVFFHMSGPWPPFSFTPPLNGDTED